MVIKTIDYIVNIIGDFLKDRKLVLVAGHPGSGKTTLAAAMCVHALRNNEKCLYVSLQEDKERLFKQLSGVGIELKPYEDKGLLQLNKLPAIASEDAIQYVFEMISKLVLDFRPKVIVVDSITPLLLSVEKDAKARGLIQNYFWELQRLVGSTVVLISEVPLGQEFVGLGGAEFIADAVLILKHRINKGLIIRHMEIRKVRGQPLTVAEIPFSIRSGEGIVFYPPILLAEAKAVRKRKMVLQYEGEELKLVEVEVPSSSTYIEYPVDQTMPPAMIYYLLSYAATDQKVLIIEYKYPEDQLIDLLVENLRGYGAGQEVINYILSRIIVKAINPSAYSIAELKALELSIIDEIKPSAVFFHDVALTAELAASDRTTYADTVFNEILYLKQRGINVVRCSSYVDLELSGINKLLADYSTVTECTNGRCVDFIVRVATERGCRVISSSDLRKVIGWLIKYISEKCLR